VLRLAVVGIDGSGKSTTTLRVLQVLCRYRTVIKPGRPNLVGDQGRLSPYWEPAGTFFEILFRKVDHTRQRVLIGWTRILFVTYAAFMERWMVRRFKPEVVLTSRCPILDPAIYQEVYYPGLSRRMTLQRRMEMTRLLTRVPPRTGYFFLRTPIPVAMDRILRRIERLYPTSLMHREYWLHLHENPHALQIIAQRLDRALSLARTQYGSGIMEIDTTTRNEEEVAAIIADTIGKLPTEFSEPLLVKV